jgi:hypothetical protein
MKAPEIRVTNPELRVRGVRSAAAGTTAQTKDKGSASTTSDHQRTRCVTSDSDASAAHSNSLQRAPGAGGCMAHHAALPLAPGEVYQTTDGGGGKGWAAIKDNCMEWGRKNSGMQGIPH